MEKEPDYGLHAFQQPYVLLAWIILALAKKPSP
jgi:hypothetical protein